MLERHPVEPSDEDPVLDAPDEEEQDDGDDQPDPSPEQLRLHTVHSKWVGRAQQLLPMLLEDRAALQAKRAAMPPGEDQQEIDILLHKVDEAISRTRYGETTWPGPLQDGAGPRPNRTQNEVTK